MSDALENKAVEILDKSQAAIATFADKLTDLTKQYGPDVADAALQMARIDALSTMVPATFVLVGSFIVAKWYWTNCKAWMRGPSSDEVAIVMGGILGGLCLATFSAWALVQLLDIWRWVGIFEPKLWLAKRILGL